MRRLSFNGVLSTTLLGLWMFFKVSCEQSVCQPCEFQTNVSTTEISISICSFEFIKNYTPEPGMYTIELNCSRDFDTDQPHQNGQNETTNNTAVLENLTSGTLYNISVVTVGPMGYHSSAATAGIYTRPYPIHGLNATTINTTVVVLHWHRPQGYQQGYSYRVETSCCMPTPRNQTEQNSMATVTNLVPGTNCSFTVYSQVQNGIEGEPISVYQYTKPERVSPAVSNRGTNDTIEVTWLPPLGNVEKYMVNLTSNYGDNQTKFLNSSFQSQLFSGLTPGRKYTVVVTTISGPFAEDSEPVSNVTYWRLAWNSVVS